MTTPRTLLLGKFRNLFSSINTTVRHTYTIIVHAYTVYFTLHRAPITAVPAYIKIIQYKIKAPALYTFFSLLMTARADYSKR